MNAPATKIVIAAGGTAGHVAPALAVADALRADGAEVTFVGGARAEAQLVPAAGYPLHTISVEGMSRTNPLLAVRAVVRAALAVPRARAILRALNPDAVLGGGGYVAGPVGLAALSLRIPLVLSEADSHLGLANRLLARGAWRVCLAFPIPGRDEVGYRVTGRPIPILVPDADRVQARARFAITEGETCVLVFGGSLGARSINRAAVGAFAGDQVPGAGEGSGADARPDGGAEPGNTEGEGLLAGMRMGASLRVLHIAGRRDYAELTARPLPAGYDLREYLSLTEFAQALAAADLVIARSGGSVFEIAAYGLPAILVPYPHASADHQSTNARWMVAAGAAIVIPDGELSAPRLAAETAALLGDRVRLGAMADASRGLARPHAAREVAEELLQAARQAARA